MSTPISATTQVAPVKIYDVRDTNKNGTVSLGEQLNYELNHPPVKKTPPMHANPVHSVPTNDQQNTDVKSLEGGSLNSLV